MLTKLYRKGDRSDIRFLLLTACVVPPENSDFATAPPEEEAPVQRRGSISAPIHELPKDEARRALLQHVEAKCCFGKGAAKKMDITNVNHTSAYHVSCF